MMDSWHSYPSIYAMGHRLLKDLLTVDVNVEEKIDGSQFSFGLDPSDGLVCRSKGAVLNIDAPEKMFARAVETAKAYANSGSLVAGWTYRAEYLARPKHNTLAYDRVPANHLMLFDVNTGRESYLSYEDKTEEGERLGLEVVPRLAHGRLTLERFRELLETTSRLGGQKIEGVVVKPTGYDLWGPDHKVLMGKFVSEAFKEAHSLAWKETSPKSGDILDKLRGTYAVQGRWQKAVQHLAERGELEGSPRDIGKLIREAQADVEKECAEEIAAKLLEWALPHIRRGCVAGLPEWYKETLLKRQFEQEGA